MSQYDRNTPHPDDERPRSVSEVTAGIKYLLTSAMPPIWVEGEISNFSRPRSGHCYLTLKDSGAQLPAVMWRNTASRVRFELENGLAVICRGRLDVYPPHGKYQMVIEQIEPKGVGPLELAFRRLHEKLDREGLFAPERKQPLPGMIRRVAVVTSPTGAAIRDFLQVLHRRWQGIDVLIVPVRVQGDGAAREIANAIEQVNRINPTGDTNRTEQVTKPVDCIVLTRGGGSLEDLWAFNEEPVVRAIAASAIPVVSGVGHEIDVTLSDLAADVRALTPSEAAERISPDVAQLHDRLRQSLTRMHRSVAQQVQQGRFQLDSIGQCVALRRPIDMVHDRATRIDELDVRLRRATEIGHERAVGRISALAGRLDAVSPLAVLGRGYSLTQDEQGSVVRTVKQVESGQAIVTRLPDGRLVSRIESIESVV